MIKGPISKIALIGRDIKLSHSVFALPFALLATFLAAGGLPGWIELVLIVWCMFFARTFAMLANRYVDRNIDAANPRTAGRALPSGQLKPCHIIASMLICTAMLLGGAAMFGMVNNNWLPLICSPIAVIWLGMYGLMKRFTLLCHFILGAALALSPLAAAVAIKPMYLTEPPLWWLSGFVLLWVAGFDVIYGMQDIDVDRREGLYSIPAALGNTGALLAAKVCHLAALAMLTLAYRTSPQLHSLFFIGIVSVGVLLIIEHAAASRGRFTMAFFTVNGFISIVLGALGIVDVMI